MKSNLKSFYLLFSLSVVLLIPVVVLSGCSRTNEPVAQAPVRVSAQLVHSVREQEPQWVWTSGTVHAAESAQISAQVPQPILQVLVQAGDHVRAGQLLVVLDDAAMRASLSRANAAEAAAEKEWMAASTDASLATSTLARYQELKKQRSVSPQEFDVVEKRSEAAQLHVQSAAAERQEAEAMVAEARTQLGYTRLHAPFSGVITARLADPGTLASPGVPLLQIDRDGPLELYTQVDESLIDTVRTGMKVPVKIEGEAAANVTEGTSPEAGGDLTATVAQIVPAADPASRSFQVKLWLPSGKGIRAGTYGMAGFQNGTREMILAPQSAVVMRGSLACVYVVDDHGLAQLRYVTLGNPQGDQVNVLSGLSGGETLVNAPGDRDLSGAQIEGQQ
ncbi:MAG: efflux RND transporter periplasmic adaptor subunit [Acidobacteriaceae bacterium]